MKADGMKVARALKIAKNDNIPLV